MGACRRQHASLPHAAVRPQPGPRTRTPNARRLRTHAHGQLAAAHYETPRNSAGKRPLPRVGGEFRTPLLSLAPGHLSQNVQRGTEQLCLLLDCFKIMMLIMYADSQR